LGHFLHNFFGPVAHRNGVYYEKLVFGFLLVFALLGILQLAPRRWRKTIIALVTFVGGLYYLAEFLYPYQTGPHKNPFTPYLDFVTNASAVITAFAIGVGTFSLLSLHARNIVRRRGSWGNSIVLLASFVAMTVFGLLNEYAPHLRVFHSKVTSAQVYNVLFMGGYTNLTSAMFAVIAFYIASAAYRAFRIRSAEAGLLMAAALIVMLGSVSFGTVLTSWISLTGPHGVENPMANFRIENIAQWLMMQVNSPAQRGILFGLNLGWIAVSLRLWLSLERGSYFDTEI